MLHFSTVVVKMWTLSSSCSSRCQVVGKGAQGLTKDSLYRVLRLLLLSCPFPCFRALVFSADKIVCILWTKQSSSTLPFLLRFFIFLLLLFYLHVCMLQHVCLFFSFFPVFVLFFSVIMFFLFFLFLVFVFHLLLILVSGKLLNL